MGFSIRIQQNFEYIIKKNTMNTINWWRIEKAS